MTDSIREKYNIWLENARENAVLYEELKRLTDEADIEDRFYSEIEFGTGGLRGKIGVGTNRLNVYTVGRATFGVRDYLSRNKNLPQSVVIAYDGRKFSKEFARRAAEILSSGGIEVKLFDRPTPTPVCSFAIRRFKSGMGIVITASHNPKDYNGYKVYNEKGCQITDVAANELTEVISKHGFFEKFTPDESKIEILPSDFSDLFVEEIQKYSYIGKRTIKPKIVYTALNGTGTLTMRKLFAKMGITDYSVVAEQENPDSEFRTCPFPNPEEKAAMTLAVEQAKRENADLVIATDPDADRVGIAVRDGDGYRLLNGNETGVLLENYILTALKEQSRLAADGYVVKTIVTSPLSEKIARAFGLGVKNVLTGFKYIGETIDNDKGSYIFGMEESYGYLVGTHVRDKDSISAVMTIIDAYCYYASVGQTFTEALERIYKVYGYYSTALSYKVFEGIDGMHKMKSLMSGLRETPLKEILGRKVERVTDYSVGVDGLPKSDVLVYECGDIVLIVRPSGTEPKIKIYLTACGKTGEESEKLLLALRAFAEKLYE